MINIINFTSSPQLPIKALPEAAVRSLSSSFSPTMYLQKAIKAASAAWLLLNAPLASGQGGTDIAQVDGEYAYLLPYPFEGNLTQTFVGGTSVENDTVLSSLTRAQASPFISYSEEFNAILSSGSPVLAIPEAPFPFTWAGEAGVWVPDRNEVWCVSTMYGGPTSLYIISLDDNTVTKPELQAADGYGIHLPLAGPAGGYYFDGTVYLALVGNEEEPGSLVAVDPETLIATPVVNSYFGLELPSIDDVVVAYTETSEGFQRHMVSERSHMSFSSISLP